MEYWLTLPATDRSYNNNCWAEHLLSQSPSVRSQAIPEKDAIAELRRCSGTQFDPHVVEVFTKMLEREDLPQQEMEALAASYTEADTDERTGV